MSKNSPGKGARKRHNGRRNRGTEIFFLNKNMGLIWSASSYSNCSPSSIAPPTGPVHSEHRTSSLAVGRRGSLLRISAYKTMHWGIVGFLSCTAATVTQAATPGPTVAPRAPQFMLYFSRPMGGGVGGPAWHPTFGLKIAQVRLLPSSGDPQATGEALQHRELMDWQFGGHSAMRLSDMRLQLGRRLTWDVARGTFGRPSQPEIPIGSSTLRASLAGLKPLASPGARNLEPERTEHGLSSERVARQRETGRAGEHSMAALTVAALGPAQSMFLSHRTVAQPHATTRNSWPPR